MSTPIMNQYLQIKLHHRDYLLLFRLGDFYELFYEDAKLAAQILNITLTKRKQKNEEIPMAGVPVHTCDYYIAKLVESGQKVAICEQVEEASNKSEKIIKREVVRILTPGTLVDDALLNSKRNNYLIAIFQEQLNISVAIFDLSTQEFCIEDVNSENLKILLEKIEPSEILINQNFAARFPDYEEWKKKITIVAELSLSQANEKILNFFNLFSSEIISHYNKENRISIAMILEYIQLTQKMKFQLNLPIKNEQTNQVQLDKFTRRNLEIIKTLQNSKTGSLLWLLDETKTPQGARALVHLLNNPIKDIEKLNARYQKIEFFMQNKDLEVIIESLKAIPDFERIFSKILLNRSNASELRAMAIGIQNLVKICSLLSKEIKSHSTLTNKIITAIKEDFSKEDFINEGFDSELDEYRNFTAQINLQIEQLQEQYKLHTKVATLRIKDTPIGYMVEVNNSQKQKLNYEFILKQNLKTVSRYLTNELEQINYKLAQSSEFIKKKEKEIFQQLVQEIIEIANDIVFYARTTADIDLFSNLAKFCMKNNYIKPELSSEIIFEIQEGRHPILEYILKQRAQVCVANSCNLKKPVIFMTGPNMGGKSTYLRQQALIVLLAHIGMFVPAKSAKIGITDKIFSRISTNDDIMHGNSTFMMEMIEISLTLNQATSKSFIILDEVGRGTSYEEGVALAQSILEYLSLKLKSRTIFATHYLALKEVHNENINQLTMQIEEEPIHFTYKAMQGVAKKSYALNIAKIAGMPVEIIQRAQILLK